MAVKSRTEPRRKAELRSPELQELQKGGAASHSVDDDVMQSIP